MGLATVFKLSIYILTGFVGLALGVAEQGPVPFVSLPVTIIAYWWCEVGARHGLGRRGMGENWALVLGFLALLAATVEFCSDSPEGKLLAGIHLVVYLTWIVLLQKKSNYRYWLLMVLGMMHIAVGSVLTNATWYGLCMIAYLFGAIWTLSVFSLYRVAQDFASIDPESQTLVSAAASSGSGQVYNTVQFEDNARWISIRLVFGVMLTSFAGLLVGIAFFVLIPRVWVGSALGISDDSLPPAMRRHVTGQALEIRLGDMGPILESNDPVLTLRVFDNQTGRPIDAWRYAELLGLREPLFRGAILTEYDEGRWRPERAWSGATSLLPPLPDDPSIKTVVPTARQEIHLERIGTDILPCLGRPIAMRDLEGFKCGRMQSSNTLVVRRDWFKSLPGAVDYFAYSALPAASGETEMGVASAPEMVVYRISSYIQRCSDVPETLDRLRVFSRQLVEAEQQKSDKPLTDVEKARLIEGYLLHSGRFSYSLEAPTIDPDSDPVEDFLFRRHAGHCQYFASALALMLRAVGIPTRLATGFKGGEALPDGKLNVEKRFAHVWVEAWIENRRWLTLDATPEDERAESVTAIGSKRNIWTSMTSRLAGIWETNVLDISYERQEDIIYQPLRERLNSIVQFARDFWASPQTSMSSILTFLLDRRNWLTSSGTIVLLGLFGLLWLVRHQTNWFQRIWRSRKSIGATDVDRQRVEFYERFVRLMQSQGRRRELTQTQSEFVEAIALDLNSRLSDPSISGRLHSIGDLFYLVRFGDGELTDQEQSRLDELLRQLEQELRPGTEKRLQSI